MAASASYAARLMNSSSITIYRIPKVGRLSQQQMSSYCALDIIYRNTIKFYELVRRLALNAGAEGLESFLNALVAAINVVDALDDGLTLGGKGRQN